MDKNEKQQYVYIGRYYHIGNKEMPSDFKFGVTENLNQRENNLSRTKSPIKYLIVKAWKIPASITREKVEELISIVFDEEKYDGCEWYNIECDKFEGKISSLFKVLKSFSKEGDFEFSEVDLDNTLKSDDKLETDLENALRKRASYSTLNVKIGDIIITDYSAKVSFVNSIKEISKKVGIIQISLDFPNLIKQNILDFPEYKRPQSEIFENFYIDCSNSTASKKSFLERMAKKYNIQDFDIDIIYK